MRPRARQQRPVSEELPRAQVVPGPGEARSDPTLAIRTLGRPVLRYLRAILRDEDDAKDAFSLWAESLWRGLARFRGESSLETWAFRLAYRAALAVTGGAWRRRRRRLATTEASRIAETMRTATAVRRERQRKVLRELRQQLTLEEQTLIDLRVDEGLSWTAIAQVLAPEGRAPNPATVAKRFERLKARLAELLRREGMIE